MNWTPDPEGWRRSYHESGYLVVENAVLMELPLFDPIFADIIVNPRVLDILEALFESTEFSFHNYKAICKMPGAGARLQWHRDLPSIQHTTPNLITCMLCIDPMTEETSDS